MANTLSALLPEVWLPEMGAHLEKMPMLAKYAWSEPSDALANEGDTVNYQIPAVQAATSHTEGSDVTIQSLTATNVAIVLNKHYEVSYRISARDANLARAELVRRHIGPAAEALVRQIESDGVTALAPYVRNTYGTGGTTPSAMSDVAGVLGVLDEWNVPDEPRVLLADRVAYTNFLGKSEFIAANETGESNTRRTGKIGMIIGSGIEKWKYAPTVAAPNAGAAGAIDLVAGYSAGDTAIHVDGFTASQSPAFRAGEIISINHNGGGAATTYQYVIQANADTDSNGDADLTIYPGLALSSTNNDVVTRITTVNKTTRKSFAMHPQAIAFASRPLTDITAPTADSINTIDYNGLKLTVCIGWDRDSLMNQVTVHCLYGWKAVRPDFAAVLLG